MKHIHKNTSYKNTMYEYCQYTDTNDLLYPEILVHTLRIKAQNLHGVWNIDIRNRDIKRSLIKWNHTKGGFLLLGFFNVAQTANPAIPETAFPLGAVAPCTTI